VTEVQWHVSVLYHDPYDISGTFIVDDITENAASSNLLNAFYLHLSIELIDHWIPSLSYSISRVDDGSLPLSNDEMFKLGISVKIEPRYSYYQQLQSLTDEFLALSKHCNIPDPETYMLHVLEKDQGPIYFFPEPSLPPYWERRISDEGESYFFNKKTSVRRQSPEEASACLYFSFSSFQEIDIPNLLTTDEDKRAVIKIRHERNAHRLMHSTFCTRRQREKLNRLKYVTVTSPRIKMDGDVVTVHAATACIDLEHFVIGLCCLLTSLCFIMLIVVGRE
jgi:hypothetical protein